MPWVEAAVGVRGQIIGAHPCALQQVRVIPRSGLSVARERRIDVRTVTQRTPVCAVERDTPRIAQLVAAWSEPLIPAAECEEDGPARGVECIAHGRIVGEGLLALLTAAARVHLDEIGASSCHPSGVARKMAARARRLVLLGAALAASARRVQPVLEHPTAARDVLRVDPLAEGSHSRRELRAILQHIQ